MQLLYFDKRGVKCLLRVIDLCSKYFWIKALTTEKSKAVINVFIEIINESNCKPSKV